MIARLWRGWTSLENADSYERLLCREILPGIHRIHCHRGAFLLRRDVPEGVEFATLTLFDAMDAVKAFAGENYETAVVPPAARALLRDFDRTSLHYTVVVSPE